MNSNQSRINLDQIKSQVFTDSDGFFLQDIKFSHYGFVTEAGDDGTDEVFRVFTHLVSLTMTFHTSDGATLLPFR